MFVRVKLALLAAALATAAGLVACRPAPAAHPTPPATQIAPTAQAGEPAAQATGTDAPRGGIEVALAAIQWPQGPAVARVNGTEVKTEEWRQEVERQLRLVTTQYQVDWNDKANTDRLPAVLDQVVDEMVRLELMRQLATRDGVVTSDADVQRASDTTKQEVLSGGQYADFAAFLKAYELTQEQFTELMRQRALYDKLLAAHSGPTEVEQVHARHILVADEQKAKEVLDKLAAGESFESLAKTYSLDTGSKEQGGDLGWFPQGTMVPEFDKAAFALQAGQTSGAVKSEYGYHIIRVDERGVRKLEEPMASQVQQQKFSEWLDAERAKAKVELLYQAAPTPAPSPTAG